MKIIRSTFVCIILFCLLISACQNTQPVQTSLTVTPRAYPVSVTTPTPSKGHASISGRIIQGFGAHQPVANLLLSIAGLSATAVTDENGAFTFVDLPAGNWTISGDALTFTVQVSTADQILDAGLIKYPVQQMTEAYTTQVFPSEDVANLKENGSYIELKRSFSQNEWSRPSITEQREKIWSKSPYRDLPESFLQWWFEQPAVIYNTVDILGQNNSQSYVADPQFSEWRELLGVWDIDLVDDFGFWIGWYFEGFNYPDSYSDVFTGKTIEVWLLNYQADNVVKSGDHYYVDVSADEGFNIIRFQGNDGKPFQVHLIQDGREIIRLPRNCFQPGDSECAQAKQKDLLFFPSPTPTLFAYTPQPTPQPPELNTLQIINRSNLSSLVPVWRYEPPDAKGSDGSFDFDFSPDGRKIAMIRDNQAVLMDIESTQILQTYTLDTLASEGRQPDLWSVQFSPDGRHLAGDTEIGLVLWDVSTGTLLWKADYSQSKTSALLGGILEDGATTSLVFSPNGDWLVTTSIFAGSDIRVWSMKTGKLIKELDCDNQVDSAFSADGKQLFTADRRFVDEAIRIWDTSTWQQVGAVSVEWQAASTVLSSNGEKMIVGSMDMHDGPLMLKIYIVDGWKLTGIIEDRDPFGILQNPIITYPTLNHDGGIVAFVRDDWPSKYRYPAIVQLWDTTNQQHLLDLDGKFPMRVWRVRFSPDGRLLAAQSKNGTTIFWGVPSP
ncbi:MAG TPA: hypothetical protein PKD23_05525 [Bellilinea sp.]|nr:hypothetical protein [Bellilinea sp.]